MSAYLFIPEPCRLNKIIPMERFGIDSSSDLQSCIKQITWIGSIKPELWEVIAVTTDNDFYEELQIIEVIITSAEDIYRIARMIYSNISYKVIIIFRLNDKYLLSSSYSSINVANTNKNSVTAVCLSHWLHDDSLSSKGSEFIQRISDLLNHEKSLENMYKEIRIAIKSFSLGGINTLAMVERMIKELLGHCSPEKRKRILALSTPYKYEKGKRNSSYIADRYKPRNVETWFRWCYDKEDVWYCFQHNEEIQRALASRGYNDIDSLLFLVQSKMKDNYG